MQPLLPKIPLGDAIEWLVDWLRINVAPLFDAIRWVLGGVSDILTNIIQFLPPLVLIALLGLLIWLISTRRQAILGVLGLLLIYDLNLWRPFTNTFVLIIVAVLLSLIIAIPAGIWMTRSRWAEGAIKPILDFMQTMPAMIYLIPAVFFFGIGMVPGIIATIIFAIPPPVRLTYLGITQVEKEFKEMALAFGASDRQVLTKIELPLSLPSLMAGVNQCIMLAMSMVVIAGMIGAPGLGTDVYRALGRIDIASGVEAGLAVVIFAMILDSASRALGSREQSMAVRLVSRWQRRRRERAAKSVELPVAAEENS